MNSATSIDKKEQICIDISEFISSSTGNMVERAIVPSAINDKVVRKNLENLCDGVFAILEDKTIHKACEHGPLLIKEGPDGYNLYLDLAVNLHNEKVLCFFESLEKDKDITEIGFRITRKRNQGFIASVIRDKFNIQTAQELHRLVRKAMPGAPKDPIQEHLLQLEQEVIQFTLLCKEVGDILESKSIMTACMPGPLLIKQGLTGTNLYLGYALDVYHREVLCFFESSEKDKANDDVKVCITKKTKTFIKEIIRDKFAITISDELSELVQRAILPKTKKQSVETYSEEYSTHLNHEDLQFQDLYKGVREMVDNAESPKAGELERYFSRR